jgi:hypothetical protein
MSTDEQYTTHATSSWNCICIALSRYNVELSALIYEKNIVGSIRRKKKLSLKRKKKHQ